MSVCVCERERESVWGSVVCMEWGGDVGGQRRQGKTSDTGSIKLRFLTWRMVG